MFLARILYHDFGYFVIHKIMKGRDFFMKNPNNYGTIYKMKGNRRKPWIARKTIGYDPIIGTQKKVTIGCYETKKEAMEALYFYFEKPERLFSDKMTFKEIFHLWREDHYKKITPYTRKHYDKFYRVCISDYFDKMIFKEIKTLQIQKFIDGLCSHYARATIKIIRAILKSIWSFALKNDYIDKNIVELVDINNEAKRKVINRRVFTKNEIQILFNNTHIPYIDTILILIFTGLRINELLSLKNTDINLEEKYFITAGSKTDAGKNRLIPINSKVLPLVTKRMKLHNQFLIMKENSQITYSSYNYYFKKNLEKINIKNHTVHDTRHTFATLLNNANANSKSITELIGHEKYPTTERIYTHKDLEELRKAIDLL